MKTITHLSAGLLVISAVFLSCEEEVVQSSPSVPPTVSLEFQTDHQIMEENQSEIMVELALSNYASADGIAKLKIGDAAQQRFETVPASANGVLELPITKGQDQLQFKIRALNNTEDDGDETFEIFIDLFTGPFAAGDADSFQLTIQDDETPGPNPDDDPVLKTMGYETIGSQDVVKRFYEYDSEGRIAKVNWETYTPGKRSGNHTWFYDENDRLVKINKYPGRDVYYRWTNGRIERDEVYQDDVLVQYTNYAYDTQGNVAGADPYYKQDDGSFKRGMFSVFLYFYDGNIYKSLTYMEVNGTEEPVLVSTKTYDNYTTADNPFSMVEILPNVKSQKTLPTTYRVEESGVDIQYTLTYEFRDDGRPAKRVATSANDSQTTVYHYY